MTDIVERPDYHARMMNIAAVPDFLLPIGGESAYKTGHRDARHAAAEIALEANAEIARLTAERDRLKGALAFTQGPLAAQEAFEDGLLLPADEVQALVDAAVAEELERCIGVVRSMEQAMWRAAVDLGESPRVEHQVGAAALNRTRDVLNKVMLAIRGGRDND